MVDKAPRTAFVCQQCGRAAPRWLGQCPACGAWNALVEEAVRDTRRRSARSAQASAAPRPLVAVAAGETLRRSTGLATGELHGLTERYNARISEYNARCANRPFNSAIVAQLQATIACPPPQ